jgi:hypothetical protein
MKHTLFVLLLAVPSLLAQTPVAPINDAPNPYRTVESFFKLPDGRTLGSISTVEPDVDGRSIWIVDRCGANTCAGSKLPVVLKFDASGKLVRSFGEGMFLFPHGIHVDPQGNVWVVDGVPPGGESASEARHAGDDRR